MSFKLVCNYKNCLKEITASGWVTFCSHIFCEEHGSIIKRNWKSLKCPACGSVLKDSYSIIETKVNPSNEYKAIALLGMKPSDVLEIATNSIRFWIHQLNEEMCILRKKTAYYRDKLIEVKEAMERNKQSYEQKITRLTKQLDEANSKIKDLNLELLEKNKAKLQAESVPRPHHSRALQLSDIEDIFFD